MWRDAELCATYCSKPVGVTLTHGLLPPPPSALVSSCVRVCGRGHVGLSKKTPSDRTLHLNAGFKSFEEFALRPFNPKRHGIPSQELTVGRTVANFRRFVSWLIVTSGWQVPRLSLLFENTTKLGSLLDAWLVYSENHLRAQGRACYETCGKHLGAFAPRLPAEGFPLQCVPTPPCLLTGNEETLLTPPLSIPSAAPLLPAHRCTGIVFAVALRSQLHEPRNEQVAPDARPGADRCHALADRGLWQPGKIR